MFSYNFSLAIKSLKDRPWLTLLTILAIAVGLGLYTTVKTMAYQSEKIPLPHKSENLFLIQLDNREASAEEVTDYMRLVDTTFKDTMNFMQMELPGVEQTFTWKTHGVLNVEDENIAPIRTQALVGTHTFFSMFEPPFLYGNAWDKTVDNNGDAVIVISKAMNERLFGGVNSVGETIRINTLVMKVVGVLDHWHLERRFYDRSYSSARPDDFYIPYQFALDNELPRDAGFDCWSTESENARSFSRTNTQQLLNSECAWITFWAEVPDNQVENYKGQLANYVEAQKALGRFPRENVININNINDQLEYVNARNGYIKMFSFIATLFFAVCLINAVSILLAKFMRRTKEVSLRRALGAKKHIIITQHLIEVCMLGLLGGLVGIVISYFGLQGMMSIRLYASDYMIRPEDIAPFYTLDWSMIRDALITGIFCTIVISIYPIVRLCNTSPAGQLKSQ